MIERYEDEITCPYCGWHDLDSWESGLNNDGDSDIFDCPECEKKFHVSMSVSVSYSSKGLCEENNKEHNFEEFDNTHDDGKRYKGKRCLTCGETKFAKEVHPDIGDY